MVASGALLRRLRWLRTCRCRSNCLSVSDPRPLTFPSAAAAAPSRKSAATRASATKHALADAAIDFERWHSPSRATETAAGGRAGKKKDGDSTGWRGDGEGKRT